MNDTRDYGAKRDFRDTPEPRGGEGAESRSHDRPRFVVQEHDASSHHFDFRLEVDGVLRSWAVPKGPSTDPREKRLALPTEDHPLEYADFEGVIPKDEYGAGAVIIWDRGSYRSPAGDVEDENEGAGEAPDIAAALDDGHATVWLDGEKLRGGYALTRITGGEREGQRWLLVKMDDEKADARRNPVSTEPRSVKSGKTLEELEQDEGG